jgi:hypothetical protein
VDGDLGLHLDDGDLVGERIVQFPGDVQPFLVGAAPRRLLPRPLGLVRPPLGLSQRFPGGTGGDQPGQLEDIPGVGERLAQGPVRAGGQDRQRENGQHDHRTRHRDDAVARTHRGVHREEVGDGGNVEADRLVAHGAQSGGGEHGDRRPTVRRQRQTAGDEQRVAQRIEIGGGGVPREPSCRSVTCPPPPLPPSSGWS